jgi:hypothetical protein
MKIAMIVVGAFLGCGLAGGLIGYGSEGTLKAACLGAGIGLIAPVAFMVICQPEITYTKGKSKDDS